MVVQKKVYLSYHAETFYFCEVPRFHEAGSFLMVAITPKQAK